MPIVYILLAVIAIVFLILFIKFFGLWFRSLLSGAPVGIARLIGMWLRKVNQEMIVDSRVMLTKAGIPLNTDLLETHYLARGNVLKVCMALFAAIKVNILLTFQRAEAIDLSGRDVLENLDKISKTVLEKGLDAGTAFEIFALLLLMYLQRLTDLKVERKRKVI